MMRVPTQQHRSRGGEIVDGATVPVAVVASRTEAELIVGMLRSNGLRAVVSADDAGGVEPQLQLQGVRVLVAASDEAAARQLIAEADETPAEAGEGPRVIYSVAQAGASARGRAPRKGQRPRRVSPGRSGIEKRWSPGRN